MECSHGLAYEVKCHMCFSEAMARVLLDAKSSGQKSSIVQGYGSDALLVVQEDVDYIRDLF